VFSDKLIDLIVAELRQGIRRGRPGLAERLQRAIRHRFLIGRTLRTKRIKEITRVHNNNHTPKPRKGNPPDNTANAGEETNV